MRSCKRKSVYLLVLAAVILITSLPMVFQNGESRKTRYYDLQLAAAEKMQQLAQVVREYKKEKNLAFQEEDRYQTGLVGQRYTGITTTLGDPAAKRTACDPDMAAMLVRMFHEAGIAEGDTVAASLSGSFPGLNLALLAACDVLGLHLKYISSVGSSMYGANDEALTFPEIAYRLYLERYIPSPPAAISMGGDRDMGDEMPEASRNAVRERVRALPVYYLEEDDFTKNLQKRRELFGRDSEIDAFVSVGGHTSSLGHDERSADLGQGVLHKKGETISLMQSWRFRQNEKTGLLQYYLGKKTAVLNILNVKRLVSTYLLPFDPPRIDHELGVSPVYYEKIYNKTAITFILLSVIGLIMLFAISQKKPSMFYRRKI